MNKTSLYFLLLTLSLSCKHSAQIKMTSEAKKIEFENPYKLDIQIEKELKESDKPWKIQVALNEYTKKGDFKRVEEIDGDSSDTSTANPYSVKELDSIKSKYSVVNAVDYISEEAKKNQIVIINEAHHNPRHRVFTRTLLKKLYDSGYRYFGLEALYNGPKGGTALANGAKILDEKDGDLNKRGYPIRASGSSYVQEPQLGNLIREAIAIGFKVFPYEKTGVGSGNPREKGQALHIKTIIDKNPEAKIVIHCGYAHVYEGTGAFETNGKSMAGWLKELTGINPLTIDQVRYSEYGSSQYYSSLLKALNLERASVLVHPNKIPLGYVKDKYFSDIAVIHPPTTYSNLRPSWLFKQGVNEVSLDLSFLDIEFPYMVFAYKSNEAIDKAIPIDLVEVYDDVSVPSLALKSGDYTIIIVNSKGETLAFNAAVK